ncbi:MAG: DUF4403 family protein [Nitrospira sp.]|nr:DUF4403 family protein [Nitrospira sp.]
MKSRDTIAIPAVAAVLLVGAACTHTIPKTVSKPSPPPITSAIPSFTAMVTDDTRAPVSQMPVQVRTDLTPIQTAIRRAVPDRLTEAGHPLEQDFRWTFVRNGEPNIHIQDGLVVIQAEYKGDIEARGNSRGCRLDPVYATLDASGTLQLVHNRETLSFAFDPTHVTVTTKPESDARCTMFNVTVNEQLPELLGLTQIKTAMAEAVHPDIFNIPFQRIWDDLGGPLSMPVASLNTRVCLYGNPREMLVSQQKGTLRETVIAGTAKQMPLVTYEPTCPEAAPTVALLNAGPPSSENTPYVMLAKIPISYQQVAHQLQDKLFHQTMVLNSTANESAVIERVSAADAYGRILLTVETTGDLRGTIYYWGTPRVDDTGRTVTVPDLQMANESRTAIDSIRVGFWQNVDRELQPKLRQALPIDLSKQVDRLKHTITGSHRSGELTIDILVTRQQPDQVRSLPQGIIVSILFEGTATATGQMALQGQAPQAMMGQPAR